MIGIPWFLARSASVHLAAAAVLVAGIPIADPAQSQTEGLVSRDSLIDLGRRVRALEEERDRLAAELETLRQRVEPTVRQYRNIDGRVDRSEPHLGPATFVLSGNMRGTAEARALDPAILFGLCADADGCVIRLGLGGIELDGEEVEAVFLGAPCALQLDRESGDWALARGCLDAAGGEVDADGMIWGRDGDTDPSGGGAEGRVILAFGNACFLAEALPRGGLGADGGGLQRDTNRDLFLVTGGPGWDSRWTFPEELLPTGPGRGDFSCSLTIRD